LNAAGHATLTETYEQLRHHTLTALPGGGRFGLAVLLREGVAAWIEHCSATPTPVLSHRSDTVSCLPKPPFHAGIAQILASIALNRMKEMQS
jgi:hypothetical protein